MNNHTINNNDKLFNLELLHLYHSNTRMNIQQTLGVKRPPLLKFGSNRSSRETADHVVPPLEDPQGAWPILSRRCERVGVFISC